MIFYVCTYIIELNDLFTKKNFHYLQHLTFIIQNVFEIANWLKKNDKTHSEIVSFALPSM